MMLTELRDKSILILGFGLEGQSTYLFLRKQFPHKHIGIADRQDLANANLPDEAEAVITVDANCSFYDGPGYLSSVSDYEVVVKSPGIPPSTPELVLYRDRGGVVTSQIEIFFDLVGSSRVIGVTGTKGKSTTSTLIYKLLKDAGIEVVLGGNIGKPPLSNVEVGSADSRWWVLELSSYQLDQIHSSPHIAVLLGIVPEHLGVHDPSIPYPHHADFQSYAGAKERITRYQTPNDILIYNADNEVTSEIALRSRARLVPISRTTKVINGSSVQDGFLVYSSDGVGKRIVEVDKIRLLGHFNHTNVMAAMTVALQLGVPEESIRRSIAEFRGLPHRIEFVGEIAGIDFYDDSISTVPEATMRALDALGPRVSTIILGGHDRGTDFSELAQCLLQKHIRTVILFPPSGLRVWDELERQCKLASLCPKPYFVESMSEAIQVALSCGVSGEICLLSPASSSYGTFKNFEERGDAFRNALLAK